MLDKELVEEAKQYYMLALCNVFKELDERYYSYGEISRLFHERYIDQSLPDYVRKTHSAFVLLSARDLKKLGVISVLSDKFSPPFVKKEANPADPAKSILGIAPLADKQRLLAQSAHAWLVAAFQSIGHRFDSDELWKAIEDNQLSDGIEPPQPSQVSNDTILEAEEWTPLPLERKSAEYREAIEASEAALREIESSNGYAVQEPDERNAIVRVISGTLSAIKEGAPSRSAIVHGLLRPLQYISKKFADSSVGEIAKMAVGKIAAWLLGL